MRDMGVAAIYIESIVVMLWVSRCRYRSTVAREVMEHLNPGIVKARPFGAAPPLTLPLLHFSNWTKRHVPGHLPFMRVDRHVNLESRIRFEQ